MCIYLFVFLLLLQILLLWVIFLSLSANLTTMHVFLSFITVKGIQPMYEVLESGTSNLVWRVQYGTWGWGFLTLLLYEVTFYDGKIFKDSLIWLVVHFLYISWEYKISSDELTINSVLSLNILDFINHISNYLHLRSSQPYIWEAYGLFSPLAMLAMYVDSRTSCPHWKPVGAGGLQVERHCLK